jgi:hypothetical protein
MKEKLKFLLKKILQDWMKKRTFIDSKFIVSILGGGEIFDEYIKLIENQFLKLGHTVNRNLLFGADIYIVVNPLFQKHKIKFNNKRSVYACIQTEQLNTHFEKGFLFLNSRMSNRTSINKLKKFDLVFESSRSNITYLSNFLSTIRFLPYPFIDKSHCIKASDYIEPEFDLIFIGSPDGIDNRRKLILEKLKGEFNVYPKHYNLWGDEKTKAIQNSKICLNLHFDHSLSFEANRFYDYISLKKLVISEFVFDSSPLIDGEHYISFNSTENLIDLVNFYLVNESDRDVIATKAHNLLLNYSSKKHFDILYNSLRVELEDKQIYKIRVNLINKLIRFSFFIYSILNSKSNIRN